MKIQFRKLITGFLVFTMAAGMLCMPAGAAVRNETAQASAAETGKTSGPEVSSESFITESTETPVSPEPDGKRSADTCVCSPPAAPTKQAL